MSIGPNGVDYTALQTEWPLLNPGTTAQKLAQLNAMVVTGLVPTLTVVSGAQIFNCLVYSEFIAVGITDSERTLLMQICALNGIQGGSSSPFIAPFFSTLAARMPQTITKLIALSTALSTPWWEAHGYLAPINESDLVAAGGLT